MYACESFPVAGPQAVTLLLDVHHRPHPADDFCDGI